MKYNKLAIQESIKSTVSALQQKGYEVTAVGNKAEALEKIKKIIPLGASVMNGSSMTLEQIGYTAYIKEKIHGWIDLHKFITDETDPVRRASLRKESVSSDYYLGSVHAMTEQGEFLVASNTGSQLPHIVSTSSNLVLVVGTQKIVPTLSTAMTRLEEYVIPLENEHMKALYGMGTQLNKIVIFKGENPMMKRHIYIILVNEILGF